MPSPRTPGSAVTLTAFEREALDLPALEVVAVGADGNPITATLALTAVIVGKDPEADIRLDDPQVSRRHCSFALTERGILLRDLGSKNGTILAGARVLEALIAPNTEITVGGTPLSVRVVGPTTSVPLSSAPRFGEALGATVVMRALFAQLDRAAATNETILVLGESGTGKELLARAVHDRSPRRDGPFVVFDCSAVAPDLLESELFGNVRGAFTGAVADRSGVLQQADGGTLFIDELGELPLDLQPKLLRAIEARQFRSVGANVLRTFDARIVAATHRELRGLVAAGAFREDLYFRLAVVRAHVPPLRERRDDIELLVGSFLASQAPPRALDELPPGALAMLKAHDWPGNVRELRNTVVRLLLFPHLGKDALDPIASAHGTLPLHLPLRQARERVVEDFERSYVVAKLHEHKGNVSRAAEQMGVSRQLLHRLMERHGIRGAGR